MTPSFETVTMMDDITLTVRYTYTPAHRGYRDSLFVPKEPDEPEEIIIHDVVDEYGMDVILSESLLESIENHILKSIKSWMCEV